jgi:hypothetical protein
MDPAMAAPAAMGPGEGEEAAVTRNRTALLVGLAVAAVLGGFLVEEATAIVGCPFTPVSFAGIARRTTRRAVIFGAGAATAAAASTSAAEASASAAPAPQPSQSHPVPTPAAKPAAQPPAVAPAHAGGAPPMGTTVGSLPGGCAESTVNDIAYQDCGGVYYRPAFQGNNLVYVVVEKP